ncbi:hypothetical protein PUN28_005241 [Cardiocondyla obscurior]|uniref:Uncharacterized protein n=1 Tax=Cardiocondyla obscurior TaxID=286306 RepID=A0AAW2GGP7_9HYME
MLIKTHLPTTRNGSRDQRVPRESRGNRTYFWEKSTAARVKFDRIVARILKQSSFMCVKQTNGSQCNEAEVS